MGCLTHPALDWLNVYGIRLLEPFSSRWFYGDTLFIIDVWLWAGMGLALWWSLRQEKRGGDWRSVGRIGATGAALYIAAQGVLTGVTEGNATGENPIASPPPGLSWQRETITGANGLYQIDTRPVGDVPLDRCDFAALRATDPDVRAFLFWSRTPFVEAGSEGVMLRDARFYDPLAADRFAVRLPDQFCWVERNRFTEKRS